MDKPRASKPAFQKWTGLLLDWFHEHKRDLPWRRTCDPYAIWISEIMLQQTQVDTVISYYNRWMQALPTIADLAHADDHHLLKLWEGLGYYSRARNLKKAANQILTEHQGVFPMLHVDILALPGIGPYTAGAICSLAFNQPTPVLDGNVARVLSRMLEIGGPIKATATQKQFWTTAQQIVEFAAQLDYTRPCGDINEALMELGATVCLPKSPKCSECPIVRFCQAHQHQTIASHPQPSPRPQITHLYRQAFVIQCRHLFFAIQNGPDQVNAGLWEFPSVAMDHPSEDAHPSFLTTPPDSLVPMLTITHSITRYRIHIQVYRASYQTRPAMPCPGEWLSSQRLESLSFAAAHRKIIGSLKKIAGQP